MYRVCLFLSAIAATLALPLSISPNSTTISPFDLEQNKNAHYNFNTDVVDHISDLTHTRAEARDGLTVKGMYSYSDGYTKRTVFYEADDKGYRITNQQEEPLTGPVKDPHGTAFVKVASHGSGYQYGVKSVPMEGPATELIDVNPLQMKL